MIEKKIKQIRNMFRTENLYSNFGPALLKIKVSGFRGISECVINFESPITALSGTNGSGKSTIVQLTACAYKKISTDTGTKRYYVKDFFNVGKLDPTPFINEAYVEYTYATSNYGLLGDLGTQTLTVRRAKSEWSGYKRQPERKVSYVGFTLYVPKVERKDFSVYHSKNLTISGSRIPSEEAIRWTKEILGNNYEELNFVTVQHQSKSTEVGRLSRNGSEYSETNMGFGEGRVLYLVDLLESSPNNSLFVLEEPETSLHPKAQYVLAQYLIDVVYRKKHQVILTTHSENLLAGLPPESRKFLLRQGSTIQVIDRISSNHAECFLSGYHRPALIICVEDKFAKEVLTEIIRKIDANLLKQVDIRPIGDKKAVSQAVSILKHDSNVIGIRDGDIGSDVSKDLYSLPGKNAPEKEVLHCPLVIDYLRDFYDYDNIDNLLENRQDINHHDYFSLIRDC